MLGSRTRQGLRGKDLSVEKPCIQAICAPGQGLAHGSKGFTHLPTYREAATTQSGNQER